MREKKALHLQAFFWILAIKDPAWLQPCRAAQTLKRCEFITKNGHKDSDLLLIGQGKAKVNAISKEKE